MAKDPALIEKIETTLLRLYRTCNTPSTEIVWEAVNHDRATLQEQFRAAVIEPFFTLEKVAIDPQKQDAFKHFYSLRDPESNQWTSLGAVEDYKNDDRAKTLGSIQRCIRLWIKYLPQLPTVVTRLWNGMYQLQMTLTRVCNLARDLKDKPLSQRYSLRKEDIDAWIKAFWEDAILMREGLKDLTPEIIQKMRQLTQDELWEVKLTGRLNNICDWVRFTRHEKSTGEVLIDPSMFARCCDNEIPNDEAILAEFRPQIEHLRSLDNAPKAKPWHEKLAEQSTPPTAAKPVLTELEILALREYITLFRATLDMVKVATHHRSWRDYVSKMLPGYWPSALPHPNEIYNDIHGKNPAEVEKPLGVFRLVGNLERFRGELLSAGDNLFTIERYKQKAQEAALWCNELELTLTHHQAIPLKNETADSKTPQKVPQVADKPSQEDDAKINGPFPPNSFVWEGKEANLSPKHYKVIDELWHHPQPTGTYSMRFDDLSEAVWGDKGTTESNMHAVCSRINDQFLGKGVKASVSMKNEYVSLSFYP